MNPRKLLQRAVLFVGGLLVALAAGYMTFSAFYSDLDLLETSGAKKTFLYRTLFDGVAKVKRPALGAMIENELLARPFQQGLSRATRVYEAPTEGGITRFLAIFPPGEIPEKFGPVRSARSYFLDWMHEWKGVYAHVGGHTDVLARLRRETGVRDGDQFFHENYFWRENVVKTSLEHTMFSGREAMEKMMDENGWTARDGADFDETPRVHAGLGAYPAAEKISIDFGFPTYRVEYQYDPIIRSYLRSQAKKPHLDQADGRQIAPKTVVVQRVKTWSNGDEKFTISMKTIGEGDATVFQQGRVIKGRWGKESLDAPTRFFDEQGREILLNLAPVWIEALPLENSFTFQAAP